MEYTVEHKKFLQYIMHEGIVDANQAEEMVITLFNDNHVDVVANMINIQLQPLNMMIKRAQCEITSKMYWMLTSTVLDEVSRFQEEFSKAKLALLRNIFSEIITSNNGCAQSTLCLNLCSALDAKLSKAEAEEFLTDMVQKNWLFYKDGNYYMGVRSITELMPYFRATYEGNLNICPLCKKAIFHGEKCVNCGNTVHFYCLKYFAMLHNPVKCSNCDNVIPTDNLPDIPDANNISNDEVATTEMHTTRRKL